MTERSSQNSNGIRGRLPSLLNPESYTAHRLQHATPDHLYLTTRRAFIGPIPEGWLNSHRRDWYKHHLHIHYSGRAATFSAAVDIDEQGQTTATAANTGSAKQKLSFPQPQILVDEHFSEEQEQQAVESEATTEEPPAVDVPRASESPETPEDKVAPQKSSAVFLKHPQVDAIRQKESRHDKSQGNTSRTGANLEVKKSQKKPVKPQLSREQSGSSFVTAHEIPPTNPAPSEDSRNQRPSLDADANVQQDGEAESSENRPSVADTGSGTASSTSPLITRGGEGSTQHITYTKQPKGILQKAKAKISSQSRAEPNGSLAESTQQPAPGRTATGLVRFNIPDDDAQQDRLLKVRLAQHRRRDTLKRAGSSKVKDGEILKMEKMLVRVEWTSFDLQEDFDENESQKIDSRTSDKWREYMVVCRESGEKDTEFTIQMYKSRVIPAVDKTHVKKRAAYDIALHRKTTRVNVFSTLDKTIVIWGPYKNGNRLFIMRPRSGTDAMEWFTFLRNLLGWRRSSLLQVNVPDLNVTLRVERPFDNLESSQNLEQAAKGDKEALVRTVKEEQAAASRIIDRCMAMLEKSPDWGSIIEAWAAPMSIDANGISRIATSGAARENDATTSEEDAGPFLPQAHDPVGLAWKRYDRLEWVHGANEKSMYGTIGMEKSHELELRPKQHYPTTVTNKKGQLLMEPPPVEGFLIRLTSQKGLEQRLGKLFYKRLYFSTHSQHLIFNRPAEAEPPPPPKLPMTENSKVPSAHQIAAKIPLIYSVNPYPVTHGQVDWLGDDNPDRSDEVAKHDEDAYDESQRTMNLILNCDGHINLCNVVKIRNIHRGATPADAYLDGDSDIDFDEDVPDAQQDDGVVQNIHDESTFEILLKNRLIVRLQAFDKTTKNEWKKRLRSLVKYWKLRARADIDLYKSVRRQNLDSLKIDEDQEALMGQFARKWEVTNSYASPEIYHMCGISFCRTIQMSGTLFRKPRLHASFQRCQVILSHGHLLVFRDSARSQSGREIANIHHQRTATLDLSDCYVYSGLITQSDLLYTSTFDTSQLGHHGLPRIYPDDGWSSTDEDTMTCFVVWHGRRQSWFREPEQRNKRGRPKLVSQLGKEGRSVVFKTRSRVERDHWVLSIGLEIERLAQSEDVRIVDK